MIRFWDTSALIKVYARTEVGHARAFALLHGSGAHSVRHVTSMLVVVELISVLTRTTRNRALVRAAAAQLDAFEQVELTEIHRDLAVQMARTGIARGADTAIAAQTVAVASAARTRCELVTADKPQALLVGEVARERRLTVRALLLPT